VYAVNGLRPDADYEVHAEFRGATTEARLVSQFLVRRDNVLNFDLPIAVIPEGVGGDGDGGIPLETFDRVVLRATFQLPEGLSGPFPVALLLHGFGEDRSVWFDLEARLLEEGWAVMALDLRGHGGSTTRNAERIEPQEGWRTDPQQFPLDLVPAINWLQTQERVSSGRMAVIGFDVGANLALIASGRYREVATAVAINANVAEAEAMAGAGQEFVPSTVQIIASSAAAAETVRQHVQGASRVTIVPGAGGTIGWVATGNALDEIIRWLRDTY